MSRHPRVELLSGWLDERIDERRRRQVEEHLEGCAECRRRLRGMERVVAGLRRLERVAPPPQLGAELERRLEWEPSRESPLRRLERRAQGLLAQPTLLPVFALVVALAAIVYLFAVGLERSRTSGLPVILEPPAPPREAPMEELLPARTVGGRSFELRDGVWVEEGLGEEPPAERLDLRAAGSAGRRLPPDLRPYALLGERVRLRLDGRIVEVMF